LFYKQTFFLTPIIFSLNRLSTATTQPPMSSFICNSCYLSFDNFNQHRHHQRNCKNTIDITFPNGKVTLTRNSDGMFICNCSHPECPRPFDKIDTLKKHIKRAGTTWRGLESDNNQGGVKFNVFFFSIFIIIEVSLIKIFADASTISGGLH